MQSLRFADLPAMCWLEEPAAFSLDRDTELTIRPVPGSDLFNHLSGDRESTAAACTVEVSGDVSLSARISIEAGGTFDAGALLIWADRDHWAKLCLEISPEGENTVVSVVTNRYSDDTNGIAFEPAWIYLRVSRRNGAWAFHYSVDGNRWRLVRVFRMTELEGPVKLGFAGQAPSGSRLSASFDQVRFGQNGPEDIRSGK